MHSVNPPRMDGIEGKACMALNAEVDVRLGSPLPFSIYKTMQVDVYRPVLLYPNRIENVMNCPSSIISLRERRSIILELLPVPFISMCQPSKYTEGSVKGSLK